MRENYRKFQNLNLRKHVKLNHTQKYTGDTSDCLQEA